MLQVFSGIPYEAQEIDQSAMTDRWEFDLSVARKQPYPKFGSTGIPTWVVPFGNQGFASYTQFPDRVVRKDWNGKRKLIGAQVWVKEAQQASEPVIHPF